MQVRGSFKEVVDSLSVHVAILDEDGVILSTNAAWKEFARTNELQGRPDCVGMNYLAVCDSVQGELADEVRGIARNIRKIIDGEQDEFLVKYSCHSPAEERWFVLRVVRYKGDGPWRAIVAHENITPIVRAHATLEKKERELECQKQKLEESNTALRVLLKHRDEEKRQMEKNLVTNVRELVMPYTERLLAAPLASEDKTLVEIIDFRLRDIVSPFMNRLRSVSRQLTPQELQVATLVREGRTSKEIAGILLVSVNAVDFHRKNIRRKLGLSNTASNLPSYLLSLS